MRTLPSLLFSLVALSGCGDTGPAPAPTAPAPAAAPAEQSPKTPSTKPSSANTATDAAAPTPLPPGVAAPGAPPIALVGHGLRIALHPPFQLARMGAAMGEHEDLVVWSWWDVADPMAGKHGRAGLYNVTIVPGSAPPTGAPLAPAVEGEGKKRKHLLRQGTAGPFLRLPTGHDALGGMGAVTAGPADPVWKLQVGDGPLLDWTDPLMVHSGDPAKGEAVRFLARPEQPWGPWPTAP